MDFSCRNLSSLLFLVAISYSERTCGLVQSVLNTDFGGVSVAEWLHVVLQYWDHTVQTGVQTTDLAVEDFSLSFIVNFGIYWLLRFCVLSRIACLFEVEGLRSCSVVDCFSTVQTSA